MPLSVNRPSPDNSDVVDRPDMSGFFTGSSKIARKTRSRFYMSPINFGKLISSMLHRYSSSLKNCQNFGTAAKSHDKKPSKVPELGILGNSIRPHKIPVRLNPFTVHVCHDPDGFEYS